MFAPMMQYRDGRPNDPVERRLVQHSGNPFSGLTPDELRSRMGYERNNPDEFRQGINPPRNLKTQGPIDVTKNLKAVQEFKPIQRPSIESVQQPQFGQQPQFNQQGMQQMMQFMQQMMQMFSMMNGQGGRGGFGGGFNQRPPMLGGGFGGGMGGGFGGGFMNQGPYGGGFGQGGYQQPRQRPMPSYPRMQNNYSQDPFGGY